MKEVILKTKRLLLTPMTDDELYELIEKEEEPHLKNACIEMLAGCADHPEERLFYTAWKIAKKEAPDESIGNFSFKGTPVRGCVEIGYGIDEPYRRNGYMTEAVRKAVAWVLTQPGVYSVSAEYEIGNVASRRVLEKNLFVPDGMGEEGPRMLYRKPNSFLWTLFFNCTTCFIMAFNSLLSKRPYIILIIAWYIGLCVGIVLDIRRIKKRTAVEHPEKAEEKKRKREAKREKKQ